MAGQVSQAYLLQHYYKVYQVFLDTVGEEDPLDPGKRLHTGIFVETNIPDPELGGLHHVVGNIQFPKGMRYEERFNYDPQKSWWYVRREFRGYVAKANYTRLRQLLQSLPRPPAQQGYNFESWNRELVWVKPNGQPYGPGESRPPVMKCNEWTENIAFPALRRAGLLIC